MNIDSWFVFPIHVFIDTQVYINESFNFSEKGKLSYFRNQVVNEKVVHLTSELVVREVEKHIKEDVSEVIDRFNKTVDDRKYAILRGNGRHQLHKLNESEIIDEAISIFHTFLSDTDAFMLHVDTIDLKSIISDYFEVKPPFGAKKDKKSEFPDAFNVSMLRKYAEHNRPVIVVSNDGDFSDEENIVCFKKLGELLDAINSQLEITQKVKDYLLSRSIYIFDEVESRLMDNGYALDVDGTDTDRKGYQHGVEYDETELFSFSASSLVNIEAVNIDMSTRIIAFSLGCKAELEFSCSFPDEELWYLSARGTIHEIHDTVIPVAIDISFKQDDGTEVFEICSLDVDIHDIELDKYTLKGDRVRTDNLDRYWDED